MSLTPKGSKVKKDAFFHQQAPQTSQPRQWHGNVRVRGGVEGAALGRLQQRCGPQKCQKRPSIERKRPAPVVIKKRPVVIRATSRSPRRRRRWADPLPELRSPTRIPAQVSFFSSVLGLFYSITCLFWLYILRRRRCLPYILYMHMLLPPQQQQLNNIFHDFHIFFAVSSLFSLLIFFSSLKKNHLRHYLALNTSGLKHHNFSFRLFSFYVFLLFFFFP